MPDGGVALGCAVRHSTQACPLGRCRRAQLPAQQARESRAHPALLLHHPRPPTRCLPTACLPDRMPQKEKGHEQKGGGCHAPGRAADRLWMATAMSAWLGGIRGCHGRALGSFPRHGHASNARSRCCAPHAGGALLSLHPHQVLGPVHCSGCRAARGACLLFGFQLGIQHGITRAHGSLGRLVFLWRGWGSASDISKPKPGAIRTSCGIHVRLGEGLVPRA